MRSDADLPLRDQCVQRFFLQSDAGYPIIAQIRQHLRKRLPLRAGNGDDFIIIRHHIDFTRGRFGMDAPIQRPGRGKQTQHDEDEADFP